MPGSGCRLFPSDNVWNTDISTLPVDPAITANTQALFNASGGVHLHPDFGPPSYGIPYAVTGAGHAAATVNGNPSITFDYAGESDPGPYPVGLDIPIEGGPDRHALTVDTGFCRLAEMFDARVAAQPYAAGSGAVWDLNSNALRPNTWTSADAAGLPILPGLVRYDEVQAGAINHALRFTLSRTANRFLWPARHQAGSASAPTLPPMGARYRLSAGFDLSGYPAADQVVLRALQRYGMLLADNGSDWYFQGAPDPNWTYGFVDALKTVPASAFEAVDESALMVDPNSGQARADCPSAIAGAATAACAVRRLSYHLDQPNDGSTWVEVDPGLRVSAAPAVAETAVVSVNIDLWTTLAGNNQDVGIFVSDGGGPDQLLAWKESGGYGGTYSPDAAFVEAVAEVAAGHSYLYSVKLKPNRPAPGGTVYAAAGTAQSGFSPTRLLLRLFPSAAVTTRVQNRSYHLDSANDGAFASWVEVDPLLRVTVSPAATVAAVVSGNMDLWTSQSGYNQDFGLFLSDNGGADRQLAWKESGGFAGTFSPNAAFVQATATLLAGHHYVVTLKWKPNRSAPAGTVYGAAGTPASGYSPTRLTVQTFAAAAPVASASAVSYHLNRADDGGSWVELDPAIRVTYAPAADGVAVAGANIDLWTSQAGYNQDVGVFVCDRSVAACAGLAEFTLLGWKESGGFAGTFSPNAAFVQVVSRVRTGHSYLFALGWKPNQPAPSDVIFGGAGTADTQFSPTTLVVSPAA